jgi:RNA polymerase sigma-32 factor
VKKFDPTRGIKLSSYAAYWIRAYILRFIMDNFRLVKLGTTEAQRKLFFNLKKEQEKLVREGISPEPRLLAERLQVSEKDVVEMQGRMGNEELSLDNPVSDDKRQTQMDRLEGHAKDAEEQLADSEVQAQFNEKLKGFAKGLKDKEKVIFEKRLLAEQPLTLQEIGDKYGLTRERVRQLEAKLTVKLRDYMAKELPDFGELSLAKQDK